MESVKAQIFEQDGNEEVKAIGVAVDENYLALFIDGKEIDLPIRKLKAIL